MKKETKMQEIRRKAKEQSDEEIAAEYKKYREAKGLETPTGGICCPDCGGMGMAVKELPILHVKVGKICKRCGGSGFLPEDKQEK